MNTTENPCDIRMTAVMTAEEIKDIIRIHPLYRKVLRDKVKVYSNWYCIFLPDVKEQTATMIAKYFGLPDTL